MAEGLSLGEKKNRNEYMNGAGVCSFMYTETQQKNVLYLQYNEQVVFVLLKKKWCRCFNEPGKQCLENQRIIFVFA